MASIRNWKQRDGIEIDEVEFADDAHAFEICVNGNHVVSIYAGSPEDTEDIRARLNAGEDVRDWEDGNGNCVGTLIAERTGDGLRQTLKRLQSDGVCYYDRLDNGADGIIWVDKANRVYYEYENGKDALWADKVIGVYYEYETDDLDLGVDDLTDDDLKDIVIGGL